MQPRLGRYAAAMIDPNRPESASLLILAVCLLAIGVAWFALLGTVLMRSEPLALDRAVYETMLTLRNPLADRQMAGLASIGDAVVLVPAIVLTMAWRSDGDQKELQSLMRISYAVFCLKKKKKRVKHKDSKSCK